jgi:hypothetical protein
MPAPALALEFATKILYKVGRTGFDSGASDAGGVYVARMKTERQAPEGKHGLCQFRRIGLRVTRTAGFTATIKVWVDDKQTKRYDASSAAVDQTVVVVYGVPTIAPEETIIEVDINAVGTYIAVEMTLNSNEVSGTFMLDELNVHYRPLRKSRQTIAAESQ